MYEDRTLKREGDRDIEKEQEKKNNICKHL